MEKINTCRTICFTCKEITRHTLKTSHLFGAEVMYECNICNTWKKVYQTDDWIKSQRKFN